MNTQIDVTNYPATNLAIINTQSLILETIKRTNTDEAAAYKQRDTEDHNISAAIISHANAQLGTEFVGFHASQTESVKLGVDCKVHATRGNNCTGVLYIKFTDLSEKIFRNTIFDVAVHFTCKDEQFVLGNVISGIFQASHRGADNAFDMVKMMQKSLTVIDMVMDGVCQTSHPLHHAIIPHAINGLVFIKQANLAYEIKNKVLGEAVNNIYNGLRSDCYHQKAKNTLEKLIGQNCKRAKLMTPRVMVDEDGITIELITVNATVNANNVVLMKHNKQTKTNLNLSEPEGRAGLARIANNILIPSESLTTCDKGDFSGSYYLPFTVTQ